MGAIHWIDKHLKQGSFFRSYLAPVVRGTRFVSLGHGLNCLVIWRLNIKDPKGREWVSELYVFGILVFGLTCLLVTPTVRGIAPLQFLAVAFPLYFVAETAFFAVRWIFTDEPQLFSYKRALAGFLLNVAGVVVFFAAALLGMGCIEAGTTASAIESVFTAFYSSLRTVVTIEPWRTQEPPGHWECALLLTSENVIAYLLTVIIIAALAGIVGGRRSEVQRR